jgi:hypothetical protein
MTELSANTRAVLEKVFASEDMAEAERILVEECGNNIVCCVDDSPEEMERIRFAAIKASGGSLSALRECVNLAQADWRDILVDAGFGDDVEAHNKWKRKLLGKE